MSSQPPAALGRRMPVPERVARAHTAQWLMWLCRLLRETFEPELLTPGTEFTELGSNDTVVEVRGKGRIFPLGAMDTGRRLHRVIQAYCTRLDFGGPLLRTWTLGSTRAQPSPCRSLLVTHMPPRLHLSRAALCPLRPLQVGPRMSFSTAWSANAVSICQSCGLGKVERIEVSRRFRLTASQPLSEEEKAKFAALVGGEGRGGEGREGGREGYIARRGGDGKGKGIVSGKG